MKPEIASKYILDKALKEFSHSFESLPNLRYLEAYLKRLEGLRVLYSTQSTNIDIPPRIRARSRDLEQNTMGLINGIKFGISFMLNKDKVLEDEYTKNLKK